MENAKWYVIHTYSGYENKVKGTIERIVENRNMHDKIVEIIKKEQSGELKCEKSNIRFFNHLL